MPSSEVEIANMALGKLGTGATIADMAENSVGAREISRWYSTARDDLLSTIDWNFARRTRDLSLTGTAPTRWTYSYAYPTDCLRLWGFDIGTPLPYPANLCKAFEVGTDGSNQLIFCDLSPATAIYSQRVTVVTRFPADFCMALATVLASMTCLAITNDRAKANDLKLEAKALIEAAEAGSANERADLESERVAESISVRGYDAYGQWPWRVNW